LLLRDHMFILKTSRPLICLITLPVT